MIELYTSLFSVSDNCQILCKKHPGGNLTRNSSETKCIRKNQICDRNRDCFYGEDEKYCPDVSYSRLKAEKITKNKNKEFWCCNGQDKFFLIFHFSVCYHVILHPGSYFLCKCSVCFKIKNSTFFISWIPCRLSSWIHIYKWELQWLWSIL